jgi:hypothetical protein
VNKLWAVLLVFALLTSGCTAPQTQTEVAVQDVTPTAEIPATQAAPATATEAATATLAPDTAVPPTATPTELAPTASPSPTPAAIADVMAYELKGSFDFFWEQANTTLGGPGYGLMRDRYPGNPKIASMASLGFGLTAYLVGIQKGYITADEAYERVNGTLDTLLKQDRTEGFFYHFVDIDTGERAWGSEVSTIDTSILLMGVLSVGEYFGGEIGAKAKQLYDDVNWPWFIDESRNMFYMAYRPEKGKGFEGHWDVYAEQLMLYVLAAGSDTHPIDAGPYYGFTRLNGQFGDGEPFIHSWFGSIFTYQYSHAWIDFRGYADREGVNWFDNSVDASQAQVDFATAMDDEYLTLGPAAWGLTASDGPGGYNGLYGAPPSGIDNKAHFIDDTLAPAGAIGSIIFVPEAAQAALLNYFAIDALKGRYGFVDAYNLTEDWFDTDVIGIDKGVSLLMLANYENDAVYAIMMKNPQILNGLSRLEIKPVAPAGGYFS